MLKMMCKFEGNCKVCRENFSEFEKIIEGLPDLLTQGKAERSLFDSVKAKVENHLKKVHKTRFPGYYASLFSLLGLLVAVAFSFVYALLADVSVLNKLSLAVFALFLLMGRLVGGILDKKVFVKKLQL